MSGTTKKSSDTSLAKRSVGRRDLLKIGASTTVIPAVLGPVSRTEKPRKTGSIEKGEAPSGPVSIGYWSGDALTSMMNARALEAGDKQFAKYGARIHMIGSSTGLDDRGNSRLQSLAVDLQLEPVAFRAWRVENGPVTNVSSPASFHAAVDDRTGLRFDITSLARGVTGAPKAGGFRLSLGKEAATTKLRAGYYVIAVGERGRSLRVNWANYELAGDNTGQTVTLRRNGKPVDEFAYVLFSVTPDNNNGGGYI